MERYPSIGIESAFADRDDATQLQLHFHASHEIILVESGSAVMRVAGEKYAVSAGSLIIISRLKRHEIEITGLPYVRRFLLIEPSFFGNALGGAFGSSLNSALSGATWEPSLVSLFRSRPSGYNHHVQLEGDDYHRIRTWMVRLQEETGRQDKFSESAAAVLLKMLVIDLYRRKPALFPVRAARQGSQQVTEAQSLIERRYLDRELDLDTIAAAVYSSPDYLSHAFRDLTGYSVMQYVTLQRVAHAKNLLAWSDFTVYRVCRLSGFGDTSHFIRMFKKVTGETPLQYKKRIRGDQEAS